MSRVLVAGCGFLGSRVASAFVARGSSVVALSRTLDQVPAGATPFRADLRVTSTLEGLPTDFDLGVFCAGADSHAEADYRETYVLGLGNLVRVLKRQHRPPRLLFTSSTAVYEQLGGEWVDETTRVAPRHFPGRTLYEAERLLRAALPAALILRCSGLYGAPRSRLVDSVRAGTAAFAPGGPWYTNRIHRDDCATAIVHLLGAGSRGKLYLASDECPADRREVLEWLAKELQAPMPQQAPSAGPRRGGNKRCSSRKLRATGFRFCYPSFREGYAHELRLLSGHATTFV